jgi:hypothetical protein
VYTEKLLATNFWGTSRASPLGIETVRRAAPFLRSIYMKMPFRKITFGEANAKEEKVDSQPSASLRPWRHRSHEPEQGFRVAGAASLPPLNLPPIVPPQQRTPHRLLRRISRPPSPPAAVTSPASPPADRRQRRAGCSVLAGLPPFLHAASRCRWNPSQSIQLCQRACGACHSSFWFFLPKE